MSVQSGPARTRRNLSRSERREQILRAALRAFSRSGYHGTHVAAIVEEAGVARGTFYLHFKSKHEVFAELVDRMLGIFLELPVVDWRQVGSLDQAAALLGRNYRRLLATLREHRGLCRLLFNEAAGQDKGFRTALDEHYGAWRRRVAGQLEELVDRGLARPDLDVEVTAEAVVGMVERLVRRYVLAEEEPDLDRLASALTRLELEGVRV